MFTKENRGYLPATVKLTTVERLALPTQYQRERLDRWNALARQQRDANDKRRRMRSVAILAAVGLLGLLVGLIPAALLLVVR